MYSITAHIICLYIGEISVALFPGIFQGFSVLLRDKNFEMLGPGNKASFH